MSRYTVQPWDSLPSIARALLGSTGRWRELQLYNLKLLVNPEALAPGMILTLPPGAAIPARSGTASVGRTQKQPGPERPAMRAVARAARRRHSWSRH